MFKEENKFAMFASVKWKNAKLYVSQFPPAQSLEVTEYAFVNVLTRGDLSSLRWISSPLQHFSTSSPNVQLCKIHYASLNFRDIMLATGKLSPDAIPGKLLLF